MIFVLLFVAGMLIIPVMIDIRKHGRDNILRRSDKEVLEFKMVASMVRFSPSLVTRVSQTFPGALSILLILMLGGLAMVATIVVALAIHWFASNIVGHGAALDATRRGMSGEQLIVILIIGLIAGWLAGKVVSGTGLGLIGDIVVGIIGALIAAWLFPRLGIHLGTELIRPIIDATIGAVVALIVLKLLHTSGRVG
jgi:uncharacterized membrane protein YeaQ/YmgE (transglycosylase-associated protein family)